MQIDSRFIAAANAAGHQVLELAPILYGAAPSKGIICAANEQSFNNSFMSQPLTAFITGMTDADKIQEALDFIAAPVPAGRRFEFRKFGNVQQFLSETDDARAAGTNFKIVDFKGELETGRTINKGLAFIGDLDVVGEIPNWEQLYAGWLRVRIMRNDLRRAVTALLALHAGSGVKWVTAPVTDPETDLLDLVEALGTTTGLNANALAIGATAWSYRVQNLRSTDKAGGFASSMWTPQQLGEWLGLDQGLRKYSERYGTGSGDKTRMLGAYAVAFHRTSSPVMEDPSSLKRFITTAGAGQFQVYRRELSAKLVEISVAHYSNIVSTGSARRLNIT
jgi:hypothetical protein